MSCFFTLSLSLCMQTAIDHVENLFLTCHQSDHLCGSKINGPYPLHALVLTSIQEHDWKWWSMGGDECSIVYSMKCSMVTSALCITTHRNEFGWKELKNCFNIYNRFKHLDYSICVMLWCLQAVKSWLACFIQAINCSTACANKITRHNITIIWFAETHFCGCKILLP